MLAITGAKIFNGRKLIKEGVILVKAGKIVEVAGRATIPQGWEIIDAAGRMVTPGLIDAHTHLGIMEEGISWKEADINEATEPVTAQVRVIDAINPADRGFRDALAAGVTAVQVLPGSSNVICGVGAVVKTCGKVVEEMLLNANSGLKVAFGENPKREHGQNKKLPSTRMGAAALLRQYLIKGQDYLAGKNQGKLEERNLQLEEIARVLQKEMPLRAHAHRADDIVTALRIAKEFGVDITIEHCTEGHMIAPYLTQAKVGAAVGPTLSSRSKYELANLGWQTAKVLSEQGVPLCLITDHPVVPIGYLIVCGALAVGEGVPYERALGALTAGAAAHLGLDHRIGSISVGLDADMVLWDGSDPFDYRTKAAKTFIEGKEVYSRTN